MPSEPTPTTSCWRCQQPPMVTTGDFRDEWCVYCGAYQDPDWRVGGAAPSAPTTDAPTDALVVAAQNVLLTFHDWPTYRTDAADGERQQSLDALADAIARLRGGATAPKEETNA